MSLIMLSKDLDKFMLPYMHWDTMNLSTVPSVPVYAFAWALHLNLIICWQVSDK